jgi:hypothetical protein
MNILYIENHTVFAENVKQRFLSSQPHGAIVVSSFGLNPVARSLAS